MRHDEEIDSVPTLFKSLVYHNSSVVLDSCVSVLLSFCLFQNGAECLTRAELERARQQLEDAKRREEEQRKIIEDLKRQKQQMEQQQKKLGQAIMGDTSSVASISNIALHGSQVNTPLPLLCLPFQ